MMSHTKRLLLVAFILFSCVGCDQITKIAAQSYLTSSQPISYLGDMFRLQYTENLGAFLSLGSTLPIGLRFCMLTLLSLVVVGMFLFILIRGNLRPSLVIGVSLIVGGGLGNLIDRLFNNGAVIDFMNIGIGNLRTGIFNIADVAIMIGEGVCLSFYYRGYRAMDY